MRRVTFPLAKQPGTNLIAYPDDISLFVNAEIVGDSVVADYSGEAELDDYNPQPEAFPPQMSVYAFKQLLGADLRLRLRSLAETDPVVFDFMDLLNSAEIVDYEDQRGGPQAGLLYLLQTEAISEAEYDRLMARLPMED